MNLKKLSYIGLVIFFTIFAGIKLSADIFPSTKKTFILISTVYDIIKNHYVKEVDDQQLAEGAALGMLSSLDPYSTFYNEKELQEFKESVKGEFGGIGIEIIYENGIKVIAPIDDTPAYLAGIKSGDLIISVDGALITNINANEAIKKLRGPKNTKVKIKIIREGHEQPIEISLKRDIIKANKIKYHIYDNIGYIRIPAFNVKTADELKKVFIDLDHEAKDPLKGYIIDLRSNPGGVLDQAIEVSDLFLDHGTIVSTKGRHAKDNMTYKATENQITLLPIVILIDNGSASASEIVAGALQDHKRATIMGTKSFGKASVQSIISLNNSAVKLTIAGYFTPSGKSIAKEGIKPDIIVEYIQPEDHKKLSQKDIIKRINSNRKWEIMLKNDNQLQEAISFLNK
jgi:carboxyl-terminal processing protease